MQFVQVFIPLVHVIYYAFAFLLDTHIRREMSSEKYLFTVVYTIIVILTIYFYLKTCTDPGYIDSDDNVAILQKDTLFYCEKCQLYIPVRSSHCNKCNRCVLRKDHHCVYFGTCIGMRNHLFFMLFLAFEIVFCCLSLKTFSTGILNGVSLKEWFLKSFLSSLLFGGSIVIMFQPIILFPQHFYLALMNKTTWENLCKKKITYLSNWTKSFSPFSRGIIGNFKEFVLMRWKTPVYSVPNDEESFNKWKAENSFLTNDKYECC